jgi:GntR family transcriptional regulator
LQERLGVSPVQAAFTLTTELPTPLLAQRMRVSPTTPLLMLERISRDANGHIIERSIHHLLPEVYKLRVSAARS